MHFLSYASACNLKSSKHMASIHLDLTHGKLGHVRLSIGPFRLFLVLKQVACGVCEQVRGLLLQLAYLEHAKLCFCLGCIYYQHLLVEASEDLSFTLADSAVSWILRWVDGAKRCQTQV